MAVSSKVGRRHRASPWCARVHALPAERVGPRLVLYRLPTGETEPKFAPLANNADHSRPSAISAAGGDRFAQFDLAIGFDEIADGVTWLGAAAVRVASLVVDRPQTDLAFWSYLVAEIGFGATALASATRGAPEFVTT